MTLPLSVTLITLNEEANIGRAIESVRFAQEIIVVDSGSVDRTQEIAQKAGARVIQNPWPGYGQQKNFAQDQARFDWVLNIDADEAVSPALAELIRNRLQAVAQGECTAQGFFFPRKTFYLGRWIRFGGWYPNHLVRLADRRCSRWTEPRVHERLEVKGAVEMIPEPLDHYAFTSISDQILTNLNFSRLGSQELERRGARPSLALLLLKPLGKFVETYIFKRGFLDGLPGLIISVNAAHSIFLKYAYLFERKIWENSGKPRDARGSHDANPDPRQ